MMRVENGYTGNEACQHCEEMLTGTRFFCVECQRLLCETCGGGGPHRACPLVKCTKCRLRVLEEDDYMHTTVQSMRRLALQGSVRETESTEARPGTLEVMRRGLAVLDEYSVELRTRVLPLTATQGVHWLMWGVLHRETPLDTATMELYSTSSISRWHEQAKETTGLALVNPTKTKIYRRALLTLAKHHKRPSKAKLAFTAIQLHGFLHRGFNLDYVGGRHNRLLASFLAGGPFRSGMACSLLVKYDIVQMLDGTLAVQFLPGSEVYVTEEPSRAIIVEVNLDKNVTAVTRRLAHIPAVFFGVRMYQELVDYILLLRPPSGGTLFAAPGYYTGLISKVDTRVGVKFRANPYTASADMVKRAVRRAFPEESERGEFVLSFSSGSIRKTIAQLLWAVGVAKRLITDLGGWSPGAEASVDMYFHTRPHQRLTVLGSLLQELVRCGELPPGTPEVEPEANVLGRAMLLVQARPWAGAAGGVTGGRMREVEDRPTDSDEEEAGPSRMTWAERRVQRPPVPGGRPRYGGWNREA
jgi:hypothetical protein